jgi:hypothetical protein
MANKHLKLTPSVVKCDLGDAWFYEESHGFTIIHRLPDNKTCEIKIPWTKIRKALKRKDL